MRIWDMMKERVDTCWLTGRSLLSAAATTAISPYLLSAPAQFVQAML